MRGKWFKHIALHLELYTVMSAAGELVLRFSGLYEKGRKNAADLHIVSKNLYFDRLPENFDGYTIMLLGDVHIDGQTWLCDKIVELIQNICVDTCLFLGDYRAKVKGPFAKVVRDLDRVVSNVHIRDQLLAIRGNHDTANMFADLRAMGLRLLLNEAVEIRRKSQSLWLAGIDDPHYFEQDDIAKATAGIPRDGFKILLAHSPEAFKEASNYGYDLYLCGHTHGGQIVLRNFGPLVVNARNCRSRASGTWNYNGMLGYTTLGVGTSALPVRFNCPPEIVVMTLRRNHTQREQRSTRWL